MDLPGGDIQCSGEETCRGFPPSSLDQAKTICNSFGSRCKGFVYAVQTRKIYLKQDVTGKMISSPAYALFIKKAFYQGKEETCAVALDKFQSLADECRLPEMDPNDEDVKMRIGQPTPLQCPGYQLTRYRGGILDLTEEANKGEIYLSFLESYVNISYLSSSAEPSTVSQSGLPGRWVGRSVSRFVCRCANHSCRDSFVASVITYAKIEETPSVLIFEEPVL